MKCPICGKTNRKILATKLRRGMDKAYYCKYCDLGYLDKLLVYTKDYYNSEYRKEHSGKINNGNNSINPKELFETYYRFQDDRLKILKSYLNSKSEVLEIGASAGMFLFHIKDICKRIDAIEFDKNCCEFLEEKFGILTDSNYIENSIFKEKKYNLIYAFQVLEHTENPISFLKELKSLLKNNGLIFIEVPNLYDPLLSIWDVKFYNQFYYHSAHNFYFSEKSLNIIAEKSNLKIKDIFFLQDYNILNHLNWILTNKPQETCEMGLKKPYIKSKSFVFEDWFNNKLNIFNRDYCEKLSELKCTSNIFIILE